MKRTIIAMLLIAAVSTSVNAQSTERFIRIIGNAKHNFEANMVRLNYQVFEIAPNEYKKISYKPIETTYSEFVQEITAIGLSESDLVRSSVQAGKHRNMKTKNYYIDVDDQQALDDLSGIVMDGVNLISRTNLFLDIDPNIETKMSLESIQDAKRKAQNICSAIGMKLGRILNIEDKSSGCCTDIKESKEREILKVYKVTVTFELLD